MVKTYRTRWNLHKITSHFTHTHTQRDAGSGASERLMDMLVRELKEELEARDQPKTGNKAWLRRRLHGAIVRAHLAEREP